MSQEPTFLQRLNPFRPQTKSLNRLADMENLLGVSSAAQHQLDAKLAPESVLFAETSWYFACMLKRAGAVASIPHSFKRTRGRTMIDPDELPFDFDSRTDLFKVELDWLTYGDSFLLAIANRSGTVRRVRHVSHAPITYNDRVNPTQYERTLDDRSTQKFTMDKKGRWACRWGRETLYLIPLQAPSHLVEPGTGMSGIAHGRAAALDGNVLRFMNLVLTNHFGAGSVNRIYATSDNPALQAMLNDDEKRGRFFSRLNRVLRGTKSSSRIEGVYNGLEFKTLPSDIKSLMIAELEETKQEDICVAFETPRAIVVGDMTNRGDDDNLYKSWMSTTIIPRLEFIRDTMNRYLVGLTGHKLIIEAHKMPLFQADLKLSFESLRIAVDAGVNVDTAALMIGLSVPEGYTLTGGEGGDDEQTVPEPSIELDEPSTEPAKTIDRWVEDTLELFPPTGEAPAKETPDWVTVTVTNADDPEPELADVWFNKKASQLLSLLEPESNRERHTLAKWFKKRVKSGKSVTTFSPDYLSESQVKAFVHGALWIHSTKQVHPTGNDEADALIARFEADSQALHESLRDDEINQGEHAEQFEAMVAALITALFLLGSGVDSVDDLSEEAALALQAFITEQVDFTAGINADLADGRYEENTEGIAARVELWAIAISGALFMGTVWSGDDEALYEWRYDPAKEHCGTCLALHGTRKTAREWRKGGVLPRSRNMECGGYRCGCGLYLVE